MPTLLMPNAAPLTPPPATLKTNPFAPPDAAYPATVALSFVGAAAMREVADKVNDGGCNATIVNNTAVWLSPAAARDKLKESAATMLIVTVSSPRGSPSLAPVPGVAPAGKTKTATSASAKTDKL